MCSGGLMIRRFLSRLPGRTDALFGGFLTSRASSSSTVRSGWSCAGWRVMEGPEFRVWVLATHTCVGTTKRDMWVPVSERPGSTLKP